MAIVLGAIEALEPVLARPLLAYPGEGTQAVLPVDHRPAAQRGAGLDRHLALRGRHRPAPQVEVLVGPGLELVEVGLIEVAAELHHAHLLASLGEGPGYHSPTGP